MELYNRPAKLENKLKKLREDPHINPEDKDLILKFNEYNRAEGISVASQLKHLDALTLIATFMPCPFKQFKTKDQATTLMARLNSSKLDKKHNQSRRPATISTYIKSLKKFAKWYRNEDVTPAFLRWIPTKKYVNPPREIIDKNDIKKMVLAATNQRDKAFTVMLWESGGRISEILKLRIQDLQFDGAWTHAMLPTEGKTSEAERPVDLRSATPFLTDWLAIHPNKNNPASFLWVAFGTYYNGKPLGYNGARKILNGLARKAGITKPVNPHAFRKSNSTLIAPHLSGSQMDVRQGWVIGSTVKQTYIKRSGVELNGSVKKMYGEIVEEDFAPLMLEDTLTPAQKAYQDAIQKNELKERLDWVEQQLAIVGLQKTGRQNFQDIPQPTRVQITPDMYAMVSNSGLQPQGTQAGAQPMPFIPAKPKKE